MSVEVVSQAKQTAEALEGVREKVDPELVALPAPPRGRRLVAMTVMALTVVASMALLGSLRADVAYFFAPATVTELGDVTHLDPGGLSTNSYVSIEGTPMASGMVRYEEVLGGSGYAVFPLAGQRNVFVRLPLEDAEQGRQMARREFSGRLVSFGELGGRFSSVRDYLGDTMGMPVSSESFLLLADEPPGSYAWALFLAALCALFIVVNVVLMLRWFRPLPAAAPDAERA